MAGVEDIRAGLQLSREKAESAIASLQQADTAVGEALKALLNATQGSNQEEIHHAQSVLTEASEKISDLQGQISAANSSMGTYNARI